MLTVDLLTTTEIAAVVAFVLTAVVAVMRAPRFGSAGGRLAAAFVAVALALVGLWAPDAVGFQEPGWIGDASVVLILAFPYLLLRFTASFRDLPRGWAAAALTAGAVAVVLVLWRGDTTAVFVALGYWLAVSGVTVVRLWQAGRDEPTVARRRMRMMSAATAVLALALMVAVQLGDVSVWLDLLVEMSVLASAVAFGLGFAPPRALRLSWRLPEEQYLQAGTMAVMQATSTKEVAHELLPPVTRIVGGAGAALVDADGQVMAAYGDAPEPGTAVPTTQRLQGRDGTAQTVSLGERRGDLIVWTGPYTGFFGPEEIGLLDTMGVVAGLALERCERLELERERRAALERARRQAEAARAEADQANAAKSEFLSRMSHELRTPLNAILGFGQLLETTELDEDDDEAVGHILKAGRHLLALINDVLDLSRIEAGKLTISPEAVHAGELIDDTLALMRPQAADRRIVLTAPGAPCDLYVRTDRQRCRQVLLNLVSNAVKYNHDGGTVGVSCERLERDRLRICVTDTGAGINPDRQHRLFEPFERLGAEGSSVEGTGLGLALTKQLIERLGGQIGLRSVPGEGSTFWIDLPITSRPDEPDDVPQPAPSVSQGDTRTLLLVEDNLANLRVVEAMLRRRPHVSVLPAMQGRLALELAHQHRPDVIVLDLHLPDITGHDVLKRLQADPRTRDIPVIIASADATPRRGRQLQQDGAFDYLTKPLDLQRFLDVVDAALTSAGPHADRSDD